MAWFIELIAHFTYWVQYIFLHIFENHLRNASIYMLLNNSLSLSDDAFLKLWVNQCELTYLIIGKRFNTMYIYIVTPLLLCILLCDSITCLFHLILIIAASTKTNLFSVEFKNISSKSIYCSYLKNIWEIVYNHFCYYISYYSNWIILICLSFK